MIIQKLFILVVALLPYVSWSASFLPKTYDKQFKEATKLYLPVGYDWRLLKAQCYQESRFNLTAVSPAGAFGLCQFMPSKANELIEKHKELTNLWLPEQSIIAAAIYMDWLLSEWYYPRPSTDRAMLALASYNAGIGHILKSQEICGEPLLYAEIIECLPSVTGEHSKETIGYVKLIITKWYPVLLFER